MGYKLPRAPVVAKISSGKICKLLIGGARSGCLSALQEKRFLQLTREAGFPYPKIPQKVHKGRIKRSQVYGRNITHIFQRVEFSFSRDECWSSF